MRVAVVAAVALLAGCGSQKVAPSHRVVTPAEWKAVFSDWYDGKISEPHSCAAVIVAISHLPSSTPTYSTIGADLERYEAQVCPHDSTLSAIRVGTTDEVVGRLCSLSALRGSLALQGATGSELGGLTVSNPGPTCAFAERPSVELDWRGSPLTPPQRTFPRKALRSIGFTHVSRVLPHGRSRLVWLQWLNYCGPKLPADAKLVAALRVGGEPGALRVPLRSGLETPYCNSPADARFFVTDFATTP